MPPSGRWNDRDARRAANLRVAGPSSGQTRVDSPMMPGHVKPVFIQCKEFAVSFSMTAENGLGMLSPVYDISGPVRMSKR
jgi:hypothetical protein